MRIRTAEPNGLVAAFLLAFLATAGLFYVNIMQALVVGLADGLHIGSSRAGQIGAANTYGAALGALIGVFLVPRVPWRSSAWILLPTLIGIDLACMGLTSAGVLVAIRFVHGMVGGLLVAITYSVMGRVRDADRAFGVLLIVQYGIGGLGDMLLPGLVPRWGVQVLFLTLAGFSMVTLLMLPFLAAYPVPAKSAADVERAPLRPRALLLGAVLSALFLFQAANMGLSAYAIGLGRAAGLSLPFSSAIVGLASWFGVGGAVLVAILSTRFGRTAPLAIAFVVTLAATWLFHYSGRALIFVLANFISSIIWAFVVPYLFGLCAQLDARGYAAVKAGFASKMGLASGIAAGAQILARRSDYSGLIDSAMIALLAAALASMVAAALTDRMVRGPGLRAGTAAPDTLRAV